MTTEYRAGDPATVEETESTVKVSGYAAVFNYETTIGGLYREEIAPGAFENAIGRDDVILNVDHGGLPLARTGSGTLTLKEDKRGLYIESELDLSDPDVQQILPKMKRGDLSKMSFAFMPTRQEWDESGEVPKRTITEAQLFDVSIVTVPAYDETEVGLRSLAEHRSQREQAEKDHTRESKMRMKLALAKV